MRKIIYVLSTLVALVLAVSVSLMSVGAATDWSTKVDISTKDSITDIVCSDGLVKFTPQYIAFNENTKPVLYEFGLRTRFRVPTAVSSYFVNNSNSFILASNFSLFYQSQTYDQLSNLNINQYRYFTISVICAVYNQNGYSIDGASVLTGLTTGEIDFSELQQKFVDTIYDGQSFRCFTFGVSTRDMMMPSDLQGSVSSLLNTLELHIYPTIPSQVTFDILLSDISIRLYTSDDVFVNGFENLDDAINKGNQDMLDKIEASTSQIVGAIDGAADRIEGAVDSAADKIEGALDSQTDELLNADADADPEAGKDVDNVADNLGDAEADIDAVLPEFNPEDVYDDDVITTFSAPLQYVGGLLSDIINLDVDGTGTGFKSVIFFCLSFGVALTMAGRAVR